MSWENSTNIYAFPQVSKTVWLSRKTIGTTAKVIRLLDSDALQIYAERVPDEMGDLARFFALLVALGEVTIYYAWADQSDFTRLEVAREVSQRVGGHTDTWEPLIMSTLVQDQHEISIEDFLLLTQANPNIISHKYLAIEEWMDEKGIHRTYRPDDTVDEIRNFQIEELYTYKLEERIGYQEDKYMYHAWFYDDNWDPKWKWNGQHLLWIKDITLLDIVLDAIDNSQKNNLTWKGETLCITEDFIEKPNLSRILIHPDLVEKLVFSALQRIDSLYQNMSLEKAIEHYMKRYKK